MKDEANYFTVIACKLCCVDKDGRYHTAHYTFGPFHGVERTELCMLELAKHSNTLGAEINRASSAELRKMEDAC